MELFQASLSISPSQLFLATILTDSWCRLQACDRLSVSADLLKDAALRADVTPSRTILDASLSGLTLRRLRNQSCAAFDASLGQMQAALVRQAAGDLVPLLDWREEDTGEGPAVHVLAQLPADLDIMCGEQSCGGAPSDPRDFRGGISCGASAVSFLCP